MLGEPAASADRASKLVWIHPVYGVSEQLLEDEDELDHRSHRYGSEPGPVI
jgi:hypothetical protein